MTAFDSKLDSRWHDTGSSVGSALFALPTVLIKLLYYSCKSFVVNVTMVIIIQIRCTLSSIVGLEYRILDPQACDSLRYMIETRDS